MLTVALKKPGKQQLLDLNVRKSVLLRTSLVAQTVKHLPTIRETWVRSLGQEDPLEKEMAAHSSILAWKIPWTEEPGRLQSMGSQRVRHNWATSLTHSRTLIIDPVSLFALATRKHRNILQPNFSYHVEILWHICTKILPLDHPDLFIYALLLQVIASHFKSFFEQHRRSRAFLLLSSRTWASLFSLKRVTLLSVKCTL